MRLSPLLKLFGGMSRIRRTVRVTLIERSADPRWVTDEVVDGYMGAASLDLEGTLAAFRGMSRAQEPEQLAPRLSEVRCPVRLVIGTAIRVGGISDGEVQMLAARLPSFSVETVSDAGHFVFEENPGAVVAAVGRAFDSAREQQRIAAAHAVLEEPRR
jgi:pimeloyl-ACP methyl ester carboxylesterase